jgi:DNA polymerase-3 subunit gamma/tau
MVLLRMLAFQPAGAGASAPAAPAAGARAKPAATPAKPQAAQASAPAPARAEVPQVETAAPVAQSVAEPQPAAVPGEAQETAPEEAAPRGEMPAPGDAAGWASLVAKLPLTGMTRQMAEHCALMAVQEGAVRLSLDPAFENLRNPKWEQGLQQALAVYLGGEVRLSIDGGNAEAASPVQLRKEQEAAAQQAAEVSIAADGTLQSIVDHFDGSIQPGSIKPV